jgi:hypothetical protein
MSLKTKILIYAPYSSFRGTFQPCWGTGLCLRGGVHNIARNSDGWLRIQQWRQKADEAGFPMVEGEGYIVATQQDRA